MSLCHYAKCSQLHTLPASLPVQDPSPSALHPSDHVHLFSLSSQHGPPEEDEQEACLRGRSGKKKQAAADVTSVAERVAAAADAKVSVAEQKKRAHDHASAQNTVAAVSTAAIKPPDGKVGKHVSSEKLPPGSDVVNDDRKPAAQRDGTCGSARHAHRDDLEEELCSDDSSSADSGVLSFPILSRYCKFVFVIAKFQCLIQSSSFLPVHLQGPQRWCPEETALTRPHPTAIPHQVTIWLPSSLLMSVMHPATRIKPTLPPSKFPPH